MACGAKAKSLDSLYSTKQFLETKNNSVIDSFDFQSYPANALVEQTNLAASLILI
jgi:hypothetical protein